MDIYQIFIEHNKPWSRGEITPWSRGEITVFSLIMAAVILVLTGLLYQKKIKKSQAVAAALFVAFLGVVFASTVFTRETTVRKYELMPFWSWRDIIRYKDRSLLKENLLNCILLFPLGVLLPFIADHEVSWKRSFLTGFLCSAGIECSQLILKRGLFEWDDMIHNALGCMIGCLVMDWVIEKIKEMKRDR